MIAQWIVQFYVNVFHCDIKTDFSKIHHHDQSNLLSLYKLPHNRRLTQEDITQIVATVGGYLQPTSLQQTNPISAGEGSSNAATSSSVITYSNAGMTCGTCNITSHYLVVDLSLAMAIINKLQKVFRMSVAALPSRC